MPLWTVNTCDINDDDEDDKDSDDDGDDDHHDFQLLIVLAPPPSALPHRAVQETGAETKHFSNGREKDQNITTEKPVRGSLIISGAQSTAKVIRSERNKLQITSRSCCRQS